MCLLEKTENSWQRRYNRGLEKKALWGAKKKEDAVAAKLRQSADAAAAPCRMLIKFVKC